jgi:integrase
MNIMSRLTNFQACLFPIMGKKAPRSRLQAGYDIRQIQKLLGHSDVRTTMIYTHTIKREVKEIKSPLDW